MIWVNRCSKRFRCCTSECLAFTLVFRGSSTASHPSPRSTSSSSTWNSARGSSAFPFLCYKISFPAECLHPSAACHEPAGGRGHIELAQGALPGALPPVGGRYRGAALRAGVPMRFGRAQTGSHSLAFEKVEQTTFQIVLERETQFQTYHGIPRVQVIGRGWSRHGTSRPSTSQARCTTSCAPVNPGRST